jgi:hypothetical protein
VRRFVSRRTLVVSGVVAAVLAGGAALASSGSGSGPSAFVDSLAQHLGISTAKLQDAAKAAALDQVDNALAAGRITQQQADALKARINSGDYPLNGRGFGFGFGGGRGFGPGRFGPGPFGPGIGPMIGLGGSLDAITSYLGLSRQDLVQKLESGQSLAQIAKGQGKTTDGLVTVIVDAARKRLDQAVTSGRLTADQEKTILDRLQTMVEKMVNATPPTMSTAPPGFGFGRQTPFGRGGFMAPRLGPRFRPSGFGARI